MRFLLPCVAYYHALLTTMHCLLPCASYYHALLTTMRCHCHALLATMRCLLPCVAYYHVLLTAMRCLLPYVAYCHALPFLTATRCLLPRVAYCHALLTTMRCLLPCIVCYHALPTAMHCLLPRVAYYHALPTAMRCLLFCVAYYYLVCFLRMWSLWLARLPCPAVYIIESRGSLGQYMIPTTDTQVIQRKLKSGTQQRILASGEVAGIVVGIVVCAVPILTTTDDPALITRRACGGDGGAGLGLPDDKAGDPSEVSSSGDTSVRLERSFDRAWPPASNARSSGWCALESVGQGRVRECKSARGWGGRQCGG